MQGGCLPSEHAARSNPPSRVSNGVRILVVDADPTVQRALGNALSQAGFEVSTSGEGPEALRMARSDRPALVLIAANLPGVDGFTVVSRLRMEDGPSTHTPAILLLPENDAEARSKALRSGADDYLTKPFHPGRVDGAYAQPVGAISARRTCPADAQHRVRYSSGCAGSGGQEEHAVSGHPLLRRQGRCGNHHDRDQYRYCAAQRARPARVFDRRQPPIR